METTLPQLDIANPPAERLRLQDKEADWKLFGPYLSDRQWGTVREDYSPDGEAWSWFTHDDARSRAYRWGEDGLLGYSDRKQLLNFSFSLWNEKDPILKSRLWGLTNDEGVHGEDVKEIYFHEDATPTASYLRAKYRYPCNEFPYNDIVQENGRRRQTLYEEKKYMSEYEILDTGVFDSNRFFDVSVEYFKNNPLDTYIAITIENVSQSTENIHVLPTVYYRNTWSWKEGARKPMMKSNSTLNCENSAAISCQEIDNELPSMTLLCDDIGEENLLFCDNETDFSVFEGRSICRSLYKQGPTSAFPKNGIDKFVIEGIQDSVNPAMEGSKAAAHYVLRLAPKETHTIKLRLLPTSEINSTSINPFSKFDNILEQRKEEADQFYKWVSPNIMTLDQRDIQRKAYAGMIWSKMTYIYNVKEWLSFGPPDRRAETGRNRDWIHFNAEDVISVCDGWEYPWFAAWDAAFHNVVFAAIDPDFAKSQVALLLGHNYMNSNGQVPAYEWDFSDHNPPLQAWSAYSVYSIEKRMYGNVDLSFLRYCYPRLSRFYTWYVTSTEVDGNRLAGQSFLGLDNIAVVDRSKLPGRVEALYQADGTAWSAAMALTMMKISLELNDESSDAFASQFFVDASFHAMALNNYDGDLERPGRQRAELYSEEDGFYYDVIKLQGDPKLHQLKTPTLVGLIPMTAIETVDADIQKGRPGFTTSVQEYFASEQHSKLKERLTTDLVPEKKSSKTQIGMHVVRKEQLSRMLEKLLDSDEFFAPHGIRSTSKSLQRKPYRFDVGDGDKEFKYLPAESYGDGKMFGGNSSWRGSIWVPTTYLLIESLIKYHQILGDEYRVECPKNSGRQLNLREVAFEIASRLISLIEKDNHGHRPSLQKWNRYGNDKRWTHPLFFEYFDGDNGAGLGASHQTGWTGLIADLITRLTHEQTAY